MMPLSLPFWPDAPGAENGVGDVFDGLAFEGGDGDEGHLRAGGLLDARGVGFQLALAGGVDDVGEIADVAFGFGVARFPVDRPADGGAQREHDAQPQPLPHVELPVY